MFRLSLAALGAAIALGQPLPAAAGVVPALDAARAAPLVLQQVQYYPPPDGGEEDPYGGGQPDGGYGGGDVNRFGNTIASSTA